MGKYRICMDASGDITKEVAEKMDLFFVPMDYSLGENMRTCSGIEETEIMKLFYNGQRNKDITRTTQISPFMFVEYFSSLMKEGYSILYLGLSKGLSNTYESALLAKDELKSKYPNCELFVVDTRSATGGLGVLTERAYQNQMNGFSLEENYNDLIVVASRIKHFFMVEDIMYLKRGGRIGAAAATFATVLNIKPILKVNSDGKLETIGEKRGIKSAIKVLYELFENDIEASSGAVVYIVDADAKDNASILLDKVKEKYPELTFRRTTLSPIIGAHTGTGMLAICYIGK